MALGDAYAALTDLKPHLGIPLAETVDDAALTDALNAASREIEGHCERQFNNAGATSARIFVPDNYYLTTVDDIWTTTGLVVQADYAFSGTYGTTLNLNSDFILEPLNGVIDGEPGWPWWKIRMVNIKWFPIWIPQATVFPRPSVQVTANWGWATVPVPVKRACIMLAAQNYLMKDAPLGTQGVNNFGPVRVKDNPRIAAMLNRYCKVTAMVG
jgi:hypothetical protein